jgi:hypothetical protein
MATYRLLNREGTCTYHKIMHKRKWVGRVYQMEDGEWQAAINQEVKGRGSTAVAAFDMAVSRHLGFDSADELRNHNRRIRRGQRLVNEIADSVYENVLKGNYKPLDIVHKGEPVGMYLALRGFNRDLRKFNRGKS